MAENFAAVLTVSVDDRQYQAGVKAIERQAERTGQNIERALRPKGSSQSGGALDGFIATQARARASSEEFLSVAQRQSAGIGQLTAASGALKTGFAGAAAGAALVAAALVPIGIAATRSAGEIQRLSASFTSLTGSKEAAAQLRQELFALSKTTPFRNEEILGAAQRFLAVGVEAERLQGTINRVGALAAQSGQSLERLGLIYAQVFAKGRLTGEENLQFLEAGIDLTRQLSQVTGLSGEALRDALSKGQIGIDTFNQALKLATGDLSALTEAGKAVDIQFNNIGDNLGQLFGGFSQSIAPALSAAFQFINTAFESAFPDLASIEQFFAPITEQALRFAEILTGTPQVAETLGVALRNIGQTIIADLAEKFKIVNNILSSIDLKQLIGGLINTEFVIRRTLQLAQALGATFAKNAELGFRAASNPVQFGRDIFEAGGFSKFLEKEFKEIEGKWEEWRNSKPIEFPDFTEGASKQATAVTGDLSNKFSEIASQNKASIDGLNKQLSETQKIINSLDPDIDASAFEAANKRVLELQNSLDSIDGKKATITVEQINAGVQNGTLTNNFSNLERRSQAAQAALDNAAFGTDEFAKALRAAREAALELQTRRQAADVSPDQQANDQIRQEAANALAAAQQGAAEQGDKVRAAFERVETASNAVAQAQQGLRSSLEGAFDLLTSEQQNRLETQARQDIERAISAGLFNPSTRGLEGSDAISAAAQARSIAQAQENLANANAELVTAQDNLTQATLELVQKNWQVNVAVNAATGQSAVQLG